MRRIRLSDNWANDAESWSAGSGAESSPVAEPETLIKQAYSTAFNRDANTRRGMASFLKNASHSFKTGRVRDRQGVGGVRIRIVLGGYGGWQKEDPRLGT